MDRLRMLSDMAVECDVLCERETPAHARNLRAQLDTLRADTEQLKTDVISKQETINQALKVRLQTGDDQPGSQGEASNRRRSTRLSR